MKHKTNKYKIIDFDNWAIKIAGCVSVGVQPGKKKPTLDILSHWKFNMGNLQTHQLVRSIGAVKEGQLLHSGSQSKNCRKMLLMQVVYITEEGNSQNT